MPGWVTKILKAIQHDQKKKVQLKSLEIEAIFSIYHKMHFCPESLLINSSYVGNFENIGRFVKFGGGEQVSLSPTWILYHPAAAWPSYILQIMCVLSETVESILLCPCVHACAHVHRLMTLYVRASRICMAECMPSSFMKSTVICDKEVFLSQMHSQAW